MSGKILFPQNCTGCSACAAVCPAAAITMSADQEGFHYPQIEHKHCTECGRCIDICPVLHPPALPDADPVAWAVVSTDEDSRQNSSSGGVFAQLAFRMLSAGGRVAGAAWEEDMSVEHRLIEHPEDVPLLQGSKYVQSRMDRIYDTISQTLSEQKPVLFAGTPCQIAGMRAVFTDEKPRHLFCVDLACHGVPSPKSWNLYVQELEKSQKSKLVQVSFRDKTDGWRKYALRFEFADGSVVSHSHRQDPYLWLFLKDLSLRPSCYECPFKGLHRASDLTLADLWGAEKTAPELDDDQGTSLVLVQTAAGEAALSNCQDALTMQAVDPQAAVLDNPLIMRSAEKPRQRARFFSLLGQKNMADIVQILLKDTQGSPLLGRLKRILKR